MTGQVVWAVTCLAPTRVDICPPEEEKQLFLKPKTLKCRLEEILFERFWDGKIN